jgi:OOP family OmpA-OmpF porin
MLNKLVLAFVMTSTAIGAFAQTVTEIPARKGRSAYVEDSNGNIMRTPYGHCWRSALWTPSDAIPGCDGDLAPPITKATAPAIVSAPAATAPVVKRCDFVAALKIDALFRSNSATLTTAGKKRIGDEILGKRADCQRIEAARVSAGAHMKPSKSKQALLERRVAAIAAHMKANGMSAESAIAPAACGVSHGKAGGCMAAAQGVVEVAVSGLAK